MHSDEITRYEETRHEARSPDHRARQDGAHGCRETLHCGKEVKADENEEEERDEPELPAAVAAYPTYRGLAQLVGMRVLDSGHSLADHVKVIERHWNEHDFFFLHFKDADARGEDGDFEGKVRAIEALDRIVPPLLALRPDVVMVTGDHSTPSMLRSHSFHPVPLLLWAPATVRADDVTCIGERACLGGGLGQILARDIMPLVLAHAGRLRRFGA